MSNSFSDRLAQLSKARIGLSVLQSLRGVLHNDYADHVDSLDTALANLETSLKEASDILDARELPTRDEVAAIP